MRQITKAEALRALKNAVARRGEKHTTEDGGLYFYENGRPSCIVGDALFHEWGVKKKDINNLGFKFNGTGVPSLARKLRSEKMLDITPAAERLLAIAQNYQDSSEPWGEAVKKAVKESVL